MAETFALTALWFVVTVIGVVYGQIRVHRREKAERQAVLARYAHVMLNDWRKP